MKLIPFIRKRSRGSGNGTKDTSELDESFHPIPEEIFVKKLVVPCTGRHKRRRSSKQFDIDLSQSRRISMDSSHGITNELWKGATEKDGPVKAVDDIISYSVVRLMSRNDAARQKMLEDMLNHGEF